MPQKPEGGNRLYLIDTGYSPERVDLWKLVAKNDSPEQWGSLLYRVVDPVGFTCVEVAHTVDGT